VLRGFVFWGDLDSGSIGHVTNHDRYSRCNFGKFSFHVNFVSRLVKGSQYAIFARLVGVFFVATRQANRAVGNNNPVSPRARTIVAPLRVIHTVFGGLGG